MRWLQDQIDLTVASFRPRPDASRGPIRYWYRAEIASSKIDRLCRRIFDRRKILIERLERCKNCQERSGRRRLDNESLSFFSDNCVLSRQLEFARNSYGLIPPILEKFDVPFAHRYPVAYALAYVNAFDRAKGRVADIAWPN